MKTCLWLVFLTLTAWSESGKTLLNYAGELRLSESQRGQLSTSVEDFVQRSGDLRSQMQRAENEVATQTRQRKSLGELRISIEKAEDLRTQLRFNDVVTSRKIRQILTPEQWAHWQRIKRTNNGGQP